MKNTAPDFVKYTFKNRTSEQYTCEECKNNDRQWYEMPCDACCHAHSGFERKEDNNNEGTQSVSVRNLRNCV